MDKRFQAFVSSTYDDLKEERHEVIQALLELDCIPAGMELFPASTEDQWTLIKKVIDECDYYIVIVGGRYGSLGSEGVSFTEMEYRYAVERSKPVMAFLHKDPESLPAKKTERDSEASRKLVEFRALAQRRMCRFWQTPADLGSVVSRSLVQLMKSHPGVGWIRADRVPSEASITELLRLRMRVEELESELLRARSEPPKGIEEFAQGEERYKVPFTFSLEDPYELLDYTSETKESSLPTTWNQIFARVAPLMISEASETALQNALNDFVYERMFPVLEERYSDRRLTSFQVLDASFQTIKVQLRALGLIAKSDRQRSIKDRETYWTLTPYGDFLMTKLRAIRRSEGHRIGG